MTPPFIVEPLGGHVRTEFSCGVAELDRYFKSQVTQDIRRRVTNCFVAVEVATGTVAGYYTISAASILLSDLPEPLAKKLPRYPTLPAIRVGRLAVDRRFGGRGLGGALLADATARSLRGEAAACSVIVEAKDDAAVAFYAHHGFQQLASRPRSLFLALATAARALAGRGEKRR